MSSDENWELTIEFNNVAVWMTSTSNFESEGGALIVADSRKNDRRGLGLLV